MMEDADYIYVAREDFEQLTRDARHQPAPEAKKGSGFVAFVCNLLMIALAVVGGYFLLVIYFDAPVAPPSAPTSAPRPTVPAPFGGGGGGGSAPRPPSTLPDCATVQDSRTACQGTPGELPAGEVAEEAPAEQPTGTPDPAYVTETCLTPPGERPCWLAADQPWQPPATVPETPIVLLPEPTGVPLVFADSACAAWRPPLVMPEGCEDE